MTPPVNWTALKTQSATDMRRQRGRGLPRGRESAEPVAQGDRLQKVLAQAGLASRREAEQWIEAGRVTINGRVATLGERVAGRDELRVDGRVVRRSKDPSRLPLTRSTYLVHRAAGQSLADEILPRLPRQGGNRFVAISPMPQGDGGLELVTTDGSLATRCQRAVRLWPVDFLVRVRGALNELGQQGVEGAGHHRLGSAPPAGDHDAAQTRIHRQQQQAVADRLLPHHGVERKGTGRGGRRGTLH